MPLRNNYCFGIPEKDVDIASARFTEITGLALEPRYNDDLGGSYAGHDGNDGEDIRIVPVTKYHKSDDNDLSGIAHLLEMSCLPISETWDTLTNKLKSHYELISEQQFPYGIGNNNWEPDPALGTGDATSGPLTVNMYFGSTRAKLSDVAILIHRVFPSEMERYWDPEDGFESFTLDSETGPERVMICDCDLEDYPTLVNVQSTRRPDHWTELLSKHPIDCELLDDGSGPEQFDEPD